MTLEEIFRRRDAGMLSVTEAIHFVEAHIEDICAAERKATTRLTIAAMLMPACINQNTHADFAAGMAIAYADSLIHVEQMSRHEPEPKRLAG